MKILAKLAEAEFNELDEGLQENYRKVETGGEDPHYALEIEGLTDGLKSALQKERDKAKSSFAKVKELEAKLQETASNDELAALQKNFSGLSKTLKHVVKQQAISEAILEHKGMKALGPAYLEGKVTIDVDGDEDVWADGSGVSAVSSFTGSSAAVELAGRARESTGA